MKKLKPYMVYEKDNCCEVAILVWHYTAKEARSYYHIYAGEDYFGYDFVDLRTTLIRNKIRDVPQKDEPHIADDVVSCEKCGHWGMELDDNLICEGCRELEATDV